ncbi:MAG: hypothetical protein HY079_13290, partial [Elusimicrobia bacterium]|nr:hypothetical protein [Elusimicrobiota bacterium]
MDAPKIPTLKDSQKPQVKVRGLEAGVTLFDRLKQFKKKDLAFILAGLGTLFMAPLAEHFMMAPEQASDLTPGMSGKGGSGSGGLFGSGSSPYEVGANGLAQGSPSGGGSDIITPLNVRDPSALVMGPGATQQPPTQSAAPATPPPTAPATKDSDLRDALAASGARAAGAASKAAKALLPVPKVALSGAGGLRGLGVASGGTSASSGGGPIQSSNSLSKANSGGGLSTVKALPGYRGPASGRGQGQGGSGIEGLKKAAGDAGERMNQGAASTALTDAAAQAIPNGGTGLGGSGAGGTGKEDKAFGGNQDKGAKSVGESLEFLKQKAIQEKKIELWAKEQEAKDMNLLGHQILNDGLKTVASEGLFKPMAACIGNFMGGKPCIDPTGAGSWICNGVGDGAPPPFPIASDKVTKDSSCAGSKDKPASYYRDSANNIFACGGGGKQVGKNCILNGGADAGAKSGTGDERSVQWAQNQKTVDGLGAGCDSADSLMKEQFAQGDSGKSVRDFLTEY